MTDSLRIELYNPQQAHACIERAWREAKANLIAGRRMVLTLKPAVRSNGANALFHAQIGEISKQLGGELADEEDAKRILISAFRIDTINDPDLRDEWAKFGSVRMTRGLRGEVVVMGEQSRKFSRKLGSAFIDWLYAFGAEQGVRFTAPEWQEAVAA